jgi:hypothetical protein
VDADSISVSNAVHEKVESHQTAEVITVIGKAFWDISHAPKDQSNRRKYMPGCAIWEIHPVMKLDVQP